MSYQVLARKWRPQRFDEVVGQRGVTQTLRNALAKKRIAQAFVFAGPRGVGKTTTARILARALNCEQGPTPDPCGECDACREIAEGRDIDVLEIDAATHTQVDNVREVIVSGLAMAPVRDRYKIFVIDEVHQLSSHSFNALLKSIEEPPPHVVFMMATTEVGKIPDTILSRSQVYDFRTIGNRAIAEKLAEIAEAEKIPVEPAALAVIARTADGSMRDAQSALDQVIAFAADERITADDVAAVLGLVSRDLLFEIMEAVSDENTAALFELAGRAVEAGHDLRLLCRELSRLSRDVLVVSIDETRLDDPEVAPEGDRERLAALAGRYSREDLMRAFDLLMRAETEIRTAAEPRYSLEMALVRWVHMRKMMPIEDLIAGLEPGAGPDPGAARRATPAARSQPEPTRAAPRASAGRAGGTARGQSAAAPGKGRSASSGESGTAGPSGSDVDGPAVADDGLKDALLAEIKRTKKFLYGTVVAQAQRIECGPDTITFTFAPAHAALRAQLEQSAAQIGEIAGRLSGRPKKVVAVEAAPSGAASEPDAGAAERAAPPAAGATGERVASGGRTGDGPGLDAPAVAAAATDEDGSGRAKADLRSRALDDENVQAMLDVFPAEIRDVEEIG